LALKVECLLHLQAPQTLTGRNSRVGGRESRPPKLYLGKVMPNIKFLMRPETVGFEAPVPASKCVPDWYVKTLPYIDEQTKELPLTKDGGVNRTIKSCMPVFDAMTQGYIWKTPCDIQFNLDEFSRVTHPNMPFQVLDFTHSTQQTQHYPNLGQGFKWILPFQIQTPKGYSTLFKHPSHQDLPFTTLEGVVDTDKHPIPTHCPAYIAAEFQGVIPKGTPIVQMIPFKREAWKSMSEVDGRIEERVTQFATKFEKQYKINYRDKKVYK